MADEYDPTEPVTFNAADDDEAEDSYDPNDYNGRYEQSDHPSAQYDDDYDPSSVNDVGESSAPAAQASGTTAETTDMQPPAPKQPQKIAGFVVEESDDEEDPNTGALPPPPSQLNGSAGAESGLGTVAQAEAKAQDVSLRSAPQDTDAESTSLNGFTTVPVIASTTSSVAPDSSLQPPAPANDHGKTASPVGSVHPTPQPQQNSIAPTPQPHAQAAAPAPYAPPARLPHDKVGQLNDRIKDDPKGDTEAWLALIQYYIDKEQYTQARETYDRFFEVFPVAIPLWVKRIQWENELGEPAQIAQILQKVLMSLPNVDMWKLYMDHVRRNMPLESDTSGQRRAEIIKAFELTLDNIGVDPDAGQLWREHVDFVKDGPGTIGGQSWQDLQKVDLVRKAYQRAIKLPHSEFIKLWKEYEQFEMTLHKATGRKQIQEQSPHYMQARTARAQLEQKIDGLDRKSLPRLPPLYGCAGEDEFGDQVEKWRSWIAWERDEDPLVYKGSEDELWRKRVLYVYKQATMSLCFYPEIWYEAASWCFSTGIESLATEGEQFLESGINNNPESVLLAMMRADRIESMLESGNTDEVLIRNGEKLDKPYEAVHAALYALRAKAKEKDDKTIAEVKQYYASLPPEEESGQTQDEDDDDEESAEEKPKTRAEQEKAAVDAIKQGSAAHVDLIKRMISYVWVAKMRAFRRVQGQGKPPKKGAESGKEVKGFRGIFGQARPRGPLSSDVYIASALMEWQCYRDPSAVKIFERGMKLFPTDESFILEYIKHLISIGDVTNARVVFESTLPKIIAAADSTEEQKRDRCRPLIAYMHDFESKYGDLAQIHKIEKRMAELYPDEPEINRFSLRFSLPTFDAMQAQLILSPTQAQPKPIQPIVPGAAAGQPYIVSIENTASSPRMAGAAPEILLGPNGPYVASPKRPLDHESDNDGPARKFQRGESPLKGAAGVRMASQNTGGKSGFATKTFVPNSVPSAAPSALPQPPPMMMGPPPLPPQIEGILRVIPSSTSYLVNGGVKFDVGRMIGLCQGVGIEEKKDLFQQGRLVLRK